MNARRTLETKLKNEIKEQIHQRDPGIRDDEVYQIIKEAVLHDPKGVLLSVKEKASIINSTFFSLRREVGILCPFLEDENVSEIMVNGQGHIFIERNGSIEKVAGEFENVMELEEIIRRICGRVHREINELNPIVDARLEDGSRVNAIYKNVALDGPILTIRKFPKNPIDMNHLIELGTVTEEAAIFLKKLILAGYNIFLSGGTSSGKTTFLNGLTEYIPKNERLVVIEDSAELQINSLENVVRLECRNANAQGKGQVDMSSLIKASLRMRPDRIIVGEVRGKEITDMLQAMNTGHDGSLSTGHGNSVKGMLSRMEAMYLQAANFPITAIRTQIAEGVDIVVHMGRLKNKSRKILEICEIEASSENGFILNPLYTYRGEEGLKATGNKLKNNFKAEMNGVIL